MGMTARWIIAIALICSLGILPARPLHGAETGPDQLIKDISPGTDYSLGGYFTDLTAVGDTLYFVAELDNIGVELWKREPGAAPALVKDINPGRANALDDEFDDHGTCGCIYGVFAGVLYFKADDGVHGDELWRSDGTAAGTFMVKDINPGAASGYGGSLVRLGDFMYFLAMTAEHGRELWRTDGTAAGTTLVKDINPGPGNFEGSTLVVLNDMLYVLANDGVHGQELWRTDGSAAGTALVVDFNPGPNGNAAYGLIEVNGHLIFYSFNNGRLIASDGTAEGTEFLADRYFGLFTPGLSGIGAPAGNRLYFIVGAYRNGMDVDDLWSTDGTPAGTTRVDLPPEIVSVTGLTSLNGSAYFTASENDSVTRLWRTDGTAAGSERITSAEFTAANGSISAPQVADGSLFFQARQGQNGPASFWRSDGSTAGTALFEPAAARQIGGINNITRAGATLYFVGSSRTNGKEVWATDGTAAGTIVFDQFNQPASSTIQFVKTMNDVAYFLARDNEHGEELWRSDGSEAGTRLVRDIAPGLASGPSRNFTALGNTLYFPADDGVHGMELWRSDGTAVGTWLVADTVPGAAGGLDAVSQVVLPGVALVPIGGVIYFVASDPEHGEALWRTDGTAAGTALVKAPNPAGGLAYIDNMAAVGDTLFFSAITEAEGNELWRSDGTAAGTVLVADLALGPAHTWLSEFIAGSDQLFFQVIRSDQLAADVWRSDGTAGGTFKLRENASREPMAVIDNTVYFSTSYEGFTNTGLWRSDGTLQGTRAVYDQPQPGQGAFRAHLLTPIGNLLYFTYNSQIWRSDGTTAGTWKIKQFDSIQKIMAFNNQLYIITYTQPWPPSKQQIWRSNGTAEGTVLERTLNPAAIYVISADVGQAGSHILHPFQDSTYGNELWGWDQGADVTPPAISMPGPIVASTSDPAGTPISYSATASDDYDAAPSLGCAPASGSTFAIGATTVVCTASDASGNTASAAFTVTVALEQTPDTTPPVISVPDAVSAQTSDPNGAAVTYTATVSDAVDPTPSLSCAPPAGSTFAVGATTVVCTASDASGNSASASFTVTVALRQQLYLPLVRR